MDAVAADDEDSAAAAAATRRPSAPAPAPLPSGAAPPRRSGARCGPWGAEERSPALARSSAPRPPEPLPPLGSIGTLTGGLLARTCIFLSCKFRAPDRYKALCRWFAFKALDDETIWQHLSWSVGEHFSQWPTLKTFKDRERILAQWVEGYYVVPATLGLHRGLLVLLRFELGRLVAEAVRFWAEGHRRVGPLEEVRAKLFSVDFSQAEGAVRTSLHFDSDAAAFTAGHAASVEWQPAEVPAALSEARSSAAAATPAVQFLSPRGITTRLESWSSPPQFDELLQVDALTQDQGAAGLREATARRVQRLLGEGVALSLEPVRSPSEYVPDDPDAPQLPPGLYTGSYGHTFSFRGLAREGSTDEYEVFLVEYCSMCRGDAPVDYSVHSSLHGPLQNEPAGRRADLDVYSFLVGTEIASHLSGQRTLMALVAGGPGRHSLPPRLNRARNRLTGEWETIHRSWPGWTCQHGLGSGTVACAFLVQLEPAPGHPSAAFRFGFISGDEVVVLQRISAQRTSPFHWLPEGRR